MLGGSGSVAVTSSLGTARVGVSSVGETPESSAGLFLVAESSDTSNPGLFWGTLGTGGCGDSAVPADDRRRDLTWLQFWRGIRCHLI